MVPIEEIVTLESGSRQKGGAVGSGIPSIGGQQINSDGSILFGRMKFVSEEHFLTMKKGVLQDGDVLLVKDGATTGKTGYFDHKIPAAVNEHVFIIRGTDAVLPYYLYSVVRSGTFQEALKPYIKGIIGGVSREISAIKIPLPPLQIQRELVAEIESYQKVIDGARAVVENYRPHINIDPDWPVVEIRKACIVNPRKSELAALESTTAVSFVPMSDIGENSMYFDVKKHKNLHDVNSSYTYFRDNDVLIAKVTPCFENGKAGIAKNLDNNIGFGSSEFYVLRPSEAVISQWMYLCITTPAFKEWAIPQMTGTGGLQRVPRPVIENYKIPLPALAAQQAIVAEIEDEQSLVSANQTMIERMEKKINAAIDRVWGEKRSRNDG